jgi:hypothetical protein
MGRYPGIGDRGRIGDLQAGALVTTDGTVDWFCWAAVRLAERACFPWPRRGRYSRAAGTRGQDRFGHRSGAGYFGHSAAGLRPAQIGTVDPVQDGGLTGGPCRDRPHCRQRARGA